MTDPTATTEPRRHRLIRTDTLRRDATLHHVAYGKIDGTSARNEMTGLRDSLGVAGMFPVQILCRITEINEPKYLDRQTYAAHAAIYRWNARDVQILGQPEIRTKRRSAAGTASTDGTSFYSQRRKSAQ